MHVVNMENVVNGGGGGARPPGGRGAVAGGPGTGAAQQVRLLPGETPRIEVKDS